MDSEGELLRDFHPSPGWPAVGLRLQPAPRAAAEGDRPGATFGEGRWDIDRSTMIGLGNLLGIFSKTLNTFPFFFFWELLRKSKIGGSYRSRDIVQKQTLLAFSKCAVFQV